MRRMCIIKSQYGRSDKLRVFFYEMSSDNETDNLDEFMVKLYYSPFSENSYAMSLPISAVELVPDSNVTFIDNIPYYVESSAVV